jgi:hypothetical protein
MDGSMLPRYLTFRHQEISGFLIRWDLREPVPSTALQNFVAPATKFCRILMRAGIIGFKHQKHDLGNLPANRGPVTEIQGISKVFKGSFQAQTTPGKSFRSQRIPDLR